jgi:uncharacterized membrane protein
MTKVKKEVVVQAPVDVVYGAWRNFENFPRFMQNIREVRVSSDSRSHWVASGPLGASAEWNAEMTLDEPNHAIGWRSIPGGGSITNAGRVNFDDVGGATRVDVTLEYEAPAGPAGEAVAKIFSNPEKQIEEDLGRFKEAIERGAEASGFVYGDGPADETLGGSMGPVTESDLEKIDRAMEGDGHTEPADPDEAAPGQPRERWLD